MDRLLQAGSEESGSCYRWGTGHVITGDGPCHFFYTLSALCVLDYYQAMGLGRISRSMLGKGRIVHGRFMLTIAYSCSLGRGEVVARRGRKRGRPIEVEGLQTRCHRISVRKPQCNIIIRIGNPSINRPASYKARIYEQVMINSMTQAVIVDYVTFTATSSSLSGRTSTSVSFTRSYPVLYPLPTILVRTEIPFDFTLVCSLER